MSTDVLRHDDSFLRHLGVSAALHVSVVLLFTLKVFFFPSDMMTDQPALRVDLVALPDKIQELPPMQKSEPKAAAQIKKAVEKKVDPTEKAVVLNPKKDVKKKQLDAMNKLKQLSALENLEREAKESAKPVQTFKGNQLAQGSSPRGLERLQHDSYISNVTTHIHNHWSIPQWLAHKKLRAKVRVRLDDKGNIVNKEMLLSSGNPAFDEAALATLEKASPMPKPPERIQRLLAFQGFVVGFPE